MSYAVIEWSYDADDYEKSSVKIQDEDTYRIQRRVMHSDPKSEYMEVGWVDSHTFAFTDMNFDGRVKYEWLVTRRMGTGVGVDIVEELPVSEIQTHVYPGSVPPPHESVLTTIGEFVSNVVGSVTGREESDEVPHEQHEIPDQDRIPVSGDPVLADRVRISTNPVPAQKPRHLMSPTEIERVTKQERKAVLEHTRKKA